MGRRVRSCLVVVVASVACTPQNQQIYADVPIAAGIGVAGAVLSRASGGCFAVCAYGTVCNEATGACDPSGGSESAETYGIAVPYGLVDSGAPGVASGAPIPVPPRAAQVPPPAAPAEDEPDVAVKVAQCDLRCASGRYCRFNAEGAPECALQGPSY